MAEKIISQAKAKGAHGGARPGAGRPRGARDRKTVRKQADVAAIVGRIAVEELAKLTPVDVLRLTMLLAVRRGDLETGANYARQLLGVWQPWMARVAGPGVEGGSKTAGTVNELLRRFDDVLEGEGPGSSVDQADEREAP